MTARAPNWHRCPVRPVSTILDRFRRAAAVPAGVGDDLARELAPVFAALDEIESECDRVRADAAATAERRVADARVAAAAGSARGREAAEAARAEAEAERRRVLEREALEPARGRGGGETSPGAGRAPAGGAGGRGRRLRARGGAMSAAWVAGSVRGRLLLGRRLGRGPALDLARAGTPGEALSLLAASPYGRGAERPEDVAAAQRAIAETLLLHLRLLAGWLPPPGWEPSEPWPAGSSS